MSKIEFDQYIIDKEIYDSYIRHSGYIEGFIRICNAIDVGGGQTCDINGVLKALDDAGYKVSCK